MRYLAIDFETANSARTSICAFGYALFEDGVIKDSGVDLCRPEPNYYDYWNTRLHGIDFTATSHLPGFAGHIAKFSHYQPDFLVAHNAAFDMSCLRKWCDLAGIDYPSFPYICTLVTSKILHPGIPGYTLDAMCNLYKLPLDHHEAGSDAIACGLLLGEALKKVQATSMQDFCAKLNIKQGCLFCGGYTPCTGKSCAQKRQSRRSGYPAY